MQIIRHQHRGSALRISTALQRGVRINAISTIPETDSSVYHQNFLSTFAATFRLFRPLFFVFLSALSVFVVKKMNRKGPQARRTLFFVILCALCVFVVGHRGLKPRLDSLVARS